MIVVGLVLLAEQGNKPLPRTITQSPPGPSALRMELSLRNSCLIHHPRVFHQMEKEHL